MYFKLAIVLSLVLVGQAYKSNQRVRRTTNVKGEEEAVKCVKGCGLIESLVNILFWNRGSLKKCDSLEKAFCSFIQELQHSGAEYSSTENETGPCATELKNVTAQYLELAKLFIKYNNSLVENNKDDEEHYSKEIVAKCNNVTKAVGVAYEKCPESSIQTKNSVTVLKIASKAYDVLAEVSKCPSSTTQASENGRKRRNSGNNAKKQEMENSEPNKTDSNKKESNIDGRKKRGISQQLRNLFHF